MKIFWHREAVKDIKRIPKDHALKIHKRISELTKNQTDCKRLRGYRFNFYSLRVGDYRVILLIGKNRIEIQRIGTRGDIYKKL